MTTETASTETATTTTEGQSSTTVTTAATGAEQVSQQQTASDAQTTQTGEAKPDGDKAQQTTGAPEKYEFTPPEGQAFDKDVLGVFEAVAKKHDLSQEAAQSVLNELAPALASKHARLVEEARVLWADEAKADKEFGGEKFNESMATYAKAVKEFASDGLQGLLKESGLENHPEVIRMFLKVGKAISEDRMVSGGAATQAQTAQGFYSKSQMNP